MILVYHLLLITDYIKVFAPVAVITAVVEVIFFSLFNFRNCNKKFFLIFVFFVNIFSNVALNLGLIYFGKNTLNILIGEIEVILFEFIVFVVFLKLKDKNIIKLWLMTIFANLITFSFGKIFL
jgi:hypothetical protein